MLVKESHGKNGGNAGDLYIKISILKNDFFEINGNDIWMNLDLSPWEAALGCEVNIKNIDSSISINVPSGVQTGEVLKVANSGFWNTDGSRGDLLLNVQIVIPKELTESEKLLFLKLSEISKFKPRKK